MSEHMHVHGPHDHAVEHAASHGPGLAQWVAIFTAILSAIGAIVAYQGGNAMNEAIIHKNEAVLKKTEASDQWNYYQAASSKGHLAQLSVDIVPPEKREAYKQQIEKYETQKKEIRAKAEEFEKQSHEANEQSEAQLHPHHRLAQAITLIQIAISLASITVLTRKRWLFYVAGVAGAGGTVLWILAWL